MGDSALKRLQIGLEGGFTSGAGSVYNGGSPVAATRRLAVLKDVGGNFHFTWERTDEARGTYAGMYTTLLHMIDATGKFNALVYPDDLVFYLRMCVSGTPTIATLPTVPTALLAATAIAATMSLTTQPNASADGAASKILAITLANATTSTTAVTVTVTGTDINGNPLTEAVVFGTGTQTLSAVGGGAAALTVTLYTRNYFKTVNAAGVVCSAQPVGDTVAVAGVNGFLWTFLPDLATSTLLSATGEYFDGTAAWQLPGIVLQKAVLSAQIGKAFKFDTTFLAQKKAALVATAASITPGAQSGTYPTLTNLADSVIAAIATYATRFYADPQGVAPGTTAINARLTEFKFDTDIKTKLGKAADGTPYPNFVAREFYGNGTQAEITLLFNSYSNGVADPVELTNFLTSASRTVRCAWPGVALPCGTLSAAGGWPAWAQDAANKGGYYGCAVDLSGKYEMAEEKEVEGRHALNFKLVSEVDIASMGTPYQITLISRVNPNM